MRPKKRPSVRQNRCSSVAWVRIVVLASCTSAAACTASPSAPTPTPIQQAVTTVTATSSEFGRLSTQGASLQWEDFRDRGWECRPSPVPGRTACSPPHQGFPSLAIPADRPPSFALLAWQDGVFDGTILLLRPDVYCGADLNAATACTRHAPVCESTNAPYIYRDRIGYYECLRTVGPDPKD